MTGKNRRESVTGSFVGGMSWGGISVGSWLQDEFVQEHCSVMGHLY